MDASEGRVGRGRFVVSYVIKPPPGVYFLLYLVFEAVGYGDIQRDTARYSWIQLNIYCADTAGYMGFSVDLQQNG